MTSTRAEAKEKDNICGASRGGLRTLKCSVGSQARYRTRHFICFLWQDGGTSIDTDKVGGKVDMWICCIEVEWMSGGVDTRGCFEGKGYGIWNGEGWYCGITTVGGEEQLRRQSEGLTVT